MLLWPVTLKHQGWWQCKRWSHPENVAIFQFMKVKNQLKGALRLFFYNSSNLTISFTPFSSAIPQYLLLSTIPMSSLNTSGSGSRKVSRCNSSSLCCCCCIWSMTQSHLPPPTHPPSSLFLRFALQGFGAKCMPAPFFLNQTLFL